MTEESKTYELPKNTIPGLPIKIHLSDLIEVRKFIESIGIRTAGTRIDRYCECLRRVVLGDLETAHLVFENHPTPTFSQYTDYILYVMREVHELMWILKGLKLHQPIGVVEKLKQVVSGADFAALDSNSVSRNTQFELRIASYFCQAGFEVDLSKVTDVIAFNDRIAFYIECKRVASKAQIDKRLREAKKQLHARMPKKVDGHVIYGCVAVDVTQVAFEHNGVTWAMTNEHSQDVIQDKLINIAGNMKNDLIFADAKELLHYWLQIHMPALIAYPKAITTRFSSYHIFRQHLSREKLRAIKKFIDVFEQVSKSDERVNSSEELSLRKEITIPAGTKLDFDEALVAEFIQGGEISRRDPESIVGRLEIEGVEQEFSFFEFEMIAPTFSSEDKIKMASDPIRAGVLMLAKMLHLRQPYEI